MLINVGLNYRRLIQNYTGTKADMGFQKINISDCNKKFVFFWVCVSQTVAFELAKKNFNKLSSWTLFFFKLKLLFYMKIQKN
jgi:hypothetical protein